MTELTELTDVLAVARITRLITEDRIPFGALRDRILARAEEQASGGLGSPSRIAELLTCPWCMSMWVAFLVYGVLRRVPGWRWLSRVLAASFVTGFLASHTD